MQDERKDLIDEPMTDAGERLSDVASTDRPDVNDASDALADDAESNRSDDTALEEERDEAADDNVASHDEEAAGEEDDADLEEAEAEVAEESDEEQAEEDSDETAVWVATPTARADKNMQAPEPPEEIRMDWYILKVQSNRERSIAEALERKMRIEGLDHYFDQVIVPTEKVTEFKGGKKKVVERKLYPGYIVVHMHINDNTWFAVRETSGVGDFTGAGGKPTPMLAHEVARIIQTEEEETSESPKLDIKFTTGDKIKVKEGNFENFEGEVHAIDDASGRVIVMINIFGRSTPVELEYWQIETV
jgi:transcription termination/antitermination protein NusG